MLGLIPAAGEGTRLYPWIRAGPKELIMYGNQPVIMHVLESFKHCGIKDVCIITGHKKGALMDYVGDGDLAEVHVDYAYQVERKGLGHALLCAEKRVNACNSRSFAVFLGDTIVEPIDDVKRMIDLHENNYPFASILVEPVADPSNYGVVKIDKVRDGSGDIVSMFEKPDEEQRVPYLHDGEYFAIAGVYIFTTRLFDYLRETKPGHGGEIQLTDALKLALHAGEHVVAVLLNGKRRDFGNWRGYLQMQREFFQDLDDDKLEAIASKMEQLASSYRKKEKE